MRTGVGLAESRSLHGRRGGGAGRRAGASVDGMGQARVGGMAGRRGRLNGVRCAHTPSSEKILRVFQPLLHPSFKRKIKYN
jgi:hypothetical protein